MLSLDLRRREWTQLNRLRTGNGKCNSILQRWGFSETELCDCGGAEQTKFRILMNALSDVSRVDWKN